MKASNAMGAIARPRNRSAQWQFLYLLPALVFFIAFKYWPIFYNIILSFAKWNFVKDIRWIGLKNYQNRNYTDLIEILEHEAYRFHIQHGAEHENKDRQKQSECELPCSSVANETVNAKEQKSKYEYIDYIDYSYLRQWF